LIVDHSPTACAFGFGTDIGLEAPPGSTHGLHLIVTDIVAARDELVTKGVDVKGIRNVGIDGVWHDGPHPDCSDYNSFAEFQDPDGNVWLLQERGYSE
jgi:catechol 2,3-dioxygenase-like lactoylglutathione lyase family enzyme